jgi:hypothetical protein
VWPSMKQPARRQDVGVCAHLQDISWLMLSFLCFWANHKKCISLKPILFFNSVNARVDESTIEHADTPSRIICYTCVMPGYIMSHCFL